MVKFWTIIEVWLRAESYGSRVIYNTKAKIIFKFHPATNRKMTKQFRWTATRSEPDKSSSPKLNKKVFFFLATAPQILNELKWIHNLIYLFSPTKVVLYTTRKLKLYLKSTQPLTRKRKNSFCWTAISIRTRRNFFLFSHFYPKFKMKQNGSKIYLFIK